MTRFSARKVVGSLLLLISMVAIADVCLAHPGPVDGRGCHQDGSGRRHCH